jgi:hypothetical protein
MKNFITTVLLIFSFTAFSQNVAINSTGSPADASAMLDVQSTDKGFLVPRLTETDRTSIASPATGLLVYQSDGETGFYYFDGSDWITFLDGKKGWSLDGNAGTDPVNDFVGTSDITSLRLGTNGLANHVLFPDGTSSLSGGGFFAISNVTVLTAGSNDALRAGTTSSGPALVGQSSSTGVGVLGISAGAGPAILGTSLDTASAGEFLNTVANTTQTVFANQTAANTTSTTAAIWGESSSTSGGVFLADFPDNVTTGATGQYLGGGDIDAAGLYGFANSNANWGYGVIGEGNWYGVYAQGDLGASGGKFFMIDHPLDPENKILKHASIESNEVLNIYRGNVELDDEGNAQVQLPEYFESININFSYHLTPIGSAMPQLFVGSEVEGNSFTISGGEPGGKVSWMVQAERNDKYFQENPEKRRMEFDKKPGQVGRYIDTDSWNQSERSSYFYKMRKQPLGKSDRQTQGVAEFEQLDKDSTKVKSRP